MLPVFDNFQYTTKWRFIKIVGIPVIIIIIIVAATTTIWPIIIVATTTTIWPIIIVATTITIWPIIIVATVRPIIIIIVVIVAIRPIIPPRRVSPIASTPIIRTWSRIWSSTPPVAPRIITIGSLTAPLVRSLAVSVLGFVVVISWSLIERFVIIISRSLIGWFVVITWTLIVWFVVGIVRWGSEITESLKQKILLYYFFLNKGSLICLDKRVCNTTYKLG